jgi:transposase
VDSAVERRYNTLALYAPDGVQPAFDWLGSPRAFTAPDLVHFLLERPPCPVPLVVVLDNANLHHSHAVREALPALWANRIYFYFLPTYSPELNAIERVFRAIKHYDLPERVYTPQAALEAAVDDAYARYEAKLLAKHSYQPRLAASRRSYATGRSLYCSGTHLDLEHPPGGRSGDRHPPDACNSSHLQRRDD